MCDACGSTEFVRRADDKPETVRARLGPITSRPRRCCPTTGTRGCCVTVDGMADIDDVSDGDRQAARRERRVDRSQSAAYNRAAFAPGACYLYEICRGRPASRGRAREQGETEVARIAGVNIPSGKPVGIALTYIYGIGRTSAEKILDAVQIPFGQRVNELSEADVARVREVIDRNYRVEGDLRRDVAMNIKRLMDLGCYRGPAPPQGPAGARPAHPHQRAYPQGPVTADRRQEEGEEVAHGQGYQLLVCGVASARTSRPASPM